MESVDIEGVQLEVVRIPGDPMRSPLVFLHEGLGSVDMWHAKHGHWPSDVCAATGRAGWVYSRRGYGKSDAIPNVRGQPEGLRGPWSQRSGRHLPDYMHLEAHRVLPALLAQLGIANPVLIGHSDGATIALLHASRFSTQACVVLAPHLMVEPIALQAIEQARQGYESTAEPPEKRLRQRLSRFHADVDNAFWQWNDIWLSEGFRSFDIRTECRDIAAPLLAIQGLNDEYGTMAQLDALQKAVPHAQLLGLPKCAHSPHRDQPAAVTQAVAVFLAGLT